MGNECIIGIIRTGSHYEFATLDGLREHIRDRKEIIEILRKHEYKHAPPEWTLKDYTDFRKNTDLHRFSYCPDCGAKID